MDLPAMQIVFVQDQTKRLNGKRITAASITQNVSPPPGSFDSIAAASSHRGPASSVDDDTVPMIKGRCDPRVAVAARHDFGVWPDFQTDLLEQLAVSFRTTTGEENSRAIDFRWQLGENFA